MLYFLMAVWCTTHGVCDERIMSVHTMPINCEIAAAKLTILHKYKHIQCVPIGWRGKERQT